MKMCSIVIVIFTLYLSCVQGQSQCSTQHTTGQCVSLKKCAKLLKLTEQSNRTNSDLTLLRESLCGVDKDTFPKVCCEPNATDTDKENQRCFTPYGDEGTCSDMYNCPILANILQSPVDIHNRQNVNYLKNHRCDESAENSVCCTTCKPSDAPPHPLTGCCGIDSLNGKPDGKDSATTYINQYPWLATLEFKSKNETRRLCVGALISSKYVLTSAVCTNITGKVPHFAGKLINVLLGEYDNKYGGPDCVEIGVGGNEKCTDGAIRIPIEIAIPHGDYNPDSAMRRNDIALLRLRDRVPFTDFIRPICLPTADIPYDDRSIFFAAGWGATEHGKNSFVKLKVELPYVTPEECKQIYYKQAKLEIWEKHLCAGGVAGKDTCKGDSGGPLMYYNGKFYEIAGIVSFGPTRCGRLNYPGVYTKVYEYLPWIRSQMKP